MGGFGFASFDIMNTLFPILFALVLGFILLTLLRGLSIWIQNNRSPIVTVSAHITAMRQDASHHHHTAGDMAHPHGGHPHHHHTSITCYVTFQPEGGERMVFTVPGRTYSLLAMGDKGTLTYQGSRFLSFERI